MSDENFVQKLREFSRKIDRCIFIYYANQENPKKAMEIADTKNRLSTLLEEYDKLSGTYYLPKLRDPNNPQDDPEHFYDDYHSDDLGFD